MTNNEHKEIDNRVFVSCRRDSGESVANKFVELLKEHGYRATRDREPYSTEHLNNEILPRIGRCDYFVLVLTKNALNKCNNDNDELLLQIKAALKHGKTIVTVKDTSVNFPNDLPKSLKSLNNYTTVTVDMTNTKVFDKVVSKLCNDYLKRQAKVQPVSDKEKNSRESQTSTKSGKWKFLILPLLIIIAVVGYLKWNNDNGSVTPGPPTAGGTSNGDVQPPPPPHPPPKPDYQSNFEVPNFRRVAGSDVEHSYDSSWSVHNYPGKEAYYSSRNETYAYECSVDDKAKFKFAKEFADILNSDGLFEQTAHYYKDDDRSNRVYEGWIFEYIGPKERIETFKVVNPDSKDPYEAHVVVRCDRDYRNERKAIFVITVAKNLAYEDESSMKKSLKNKVK